MQPNTTEVTEKDLKTAYERTGLSRVGYSFEKAMDCEVTKKCLVRMALNAKKNKPKNIAVSSSKVVMATQQPYWWQKY